jgi:hypothetical protein
MPEASAAPARYATRDVALQVLCTLGPGFTGRVFLIDGVPQSLSVLNLLLGDGTLHGKNGRASFPRSVFLLC